MRVRQFSLSHAAADILWEDLELGSRPYPFDFPYFGQTEDERRGIANAVYHDLGSRGLAYRGQVQPEVVRGLNLLVRFEFSVNAIAMLDARGDQQLLALGGAAGEHAALATLDERMMKIDLIRASQLVGSIVDLLPREKPGPGQSVSVPMSAQEQPKRQRGEDDYESATFTRSVRTRSPGASRTRELEAAYERSRLRIGQFGVAVRDRRGRERRSPQIFWFDNDQGRYLSQKRRGPDGRDFLVHAPADNARIASQLNQELNNLADA